LAVKFLSRDLAARNLAHR